MGILVPTTTSQQFLTMLKYKTTRKVIADHAEVQFITKAISTRNHQQNAELCTM
jgi:hypothetical protein